MIGDLLAGSRVARGWAYLNFVQAGTTTDRALKLVGQFPLILGFVPPGGGFEEECDHGSVSAR